MVNAAVALTLANTEALTVPGLVLVPRGQTSATFEVFTNAGIV